MMSLLRYLVVRRSPFHLQSNSRLSASSHLCTPTPYWPSSPPCPSATRLMRPALSHNAAPVAVSGRTGADTISPETAQWGAHRPGEEGSHCGGPDGVSRPWLDGGSRTVPGGGGNSFISNTKLFFAFSESENETSVITIRYEYGRQKQNGRKYFIFGLRTVADNSSSKNDWWSGILNNISPSKVCARSVPGSGPRLCPAPITGSFLTTRRNSPSFARHFSNQGPNNFGSQGEPPKSSLDLTMTKRPPDDVTVPDTGVRPPSGGRKAALPYEAIPGPRPWPLVGNMFLFSKLGGYPLQQFWQSAWLLQQRFGPVVRVADVKPGLDMVWVFRPDDIRRLYVDEGLCPVRPQFDLLKVYRDSRPDLFTSPGLVNGNGPEWRRLRKAIPALMRLDTVAAYRVRQAKVASDLATAIKRVPPARKESASGGASWHEVPDLLQLLFRYTLEAVGVVALGRFQGCLSEGQPEAAHIIAANEAFLTSLGDSTFAPPLYRLVTTPTLARLRDAHDYFNSVVQRALSSLERQMSASPSEFQRQQPFAWSLLSNPGLTRQDRTLLLTEVFMGGIDATASTLAFCVYFLARSPDWQGRLFEEVREVDPARDCLQDLPLLRGVLKESYRLRPSPSGVARILQRDTVFGGYTVKKGVLVQGIPFLASRDPEHFEDPNVFNPGRWIKPDQGSSDPVRDLLPAPATAPHPFSSLPFSHGVRMCPGRRLAEQEMMLALVQMTQSFTFVCGDAPKNAPSDAPSDSHSNSTPPSHFVEDGLGQVLRLNMMPSAPIAIRFMGRE